MSKYELTGVDESLPRSVVSISENIPTANMVEYGLRDCTTDPEFHLANRLQKLRCVALELVQQLEGEGYLLDSLHLQLIDVQVEVKSNKRLTL